MTTVETMVETSLMMTKAMAIPIGISDADEEHTVEQEAPIIREPLPEPLIDISDADQEHFVEHEGPVIWEPAPELLIDLSEDPEPDT